MNKIDRIKNTADRALKDPQYKYYSLYMDEMFSLMKESKAELSGALNLAYKYGFVRGKRAEKKRAKSCSGWISVNDRLPDNEVVLAICNGEANYVDPEFKGVTLEDTVLILEYDSIFNEWYGWDYEYDLSKIKVSYWMPLPKLPKGE